MGAHDNANPCFGIQVSHRHHITSNLTIPIQDFSIFYCSDISANLSNISARFSGNIGNIGNTGNIRNIGTVSGKIEDTKIMDNSQLDSVDFVGYIL